MVLSFIAKSLKWEISTRIWLLLKEGMVVKDGKFYYYVGSLKGSHIKNNI